MSAVPSVSPAITTEDWQAIRSLKRSQVETLLEEEASIQCHDSETTQELAEVLAANLADGMIARSALDDLP